MLRIVVTFEAYFSDEVSLHSAKDDEQSLHVSNAMYFTFKGK